MENVENGAMIVFSVQVRTDRIIFYNTVSITGYVYCQVSCVSDYEWWRWEERVIVYFQLQHTPGLRGNKNLHGRIIVFVVA
jgi:hypothetical protein